MAYKLSPQARKILSEVTWNARAPIEDIARKLRMRAHTVRRAVQNLDDALNFQPLCWTDPYRLGQTPFRVFFSLSGGSPQRVRELVNFTRSLPEVSWFVSLIGLYQYCITVRADGPLELLHFFAQIDERFGDLIADKSVSTIVQLTCYIPSATPVSSEPRRHLEYVASTPCIELIDLDWKILKVLRDSPLGSMHEVGRAVGSSPATVAYRFNRLFSSGAILGFGYAYDSSHFGDREFLVSLSTKGLGATCYDKIAKYCAHHSDVLWLGRFIGHWDIELAVNAHRAQDLEVFIQGLYAICRDQLGEVHIHTFSKLHRER